jgi:hypothetical protein
MVIGYDYRLGNNQKLELQIKMVWVAGESGLFAAPVHQLHRLPSV